MCESVVAAVPAKVAALASRAPEKIWPCVANDPQQKQRVSLSQALVASPGEEKGMLDALSRAGLKIVQPPAWLHTLIVEASPLTPESCATALLVSLLAAFYEERRTDRVLSDSSNCRDW